MNRARSLNWPLLAILVGLAAAVVVPDVPPAHAQYEQAVARLRPSVVLVRGTHMLGGEGTGTGFVYNSSGCVLTNHHVIEDMRGVSISLQDGRTFQAEVTGYKRAQTYIDGKIDKWTDIAVVCVDAKNAPALTPTRLGDSDKLLDGQELIVLGYPGSVSHEKASIARGIINVRRGWLQSDAQIEPGYSGGPAIDRDGNVVAIAAFGVGRFQKISGFVPINVALRTINGWHEKPTPKPRKDFWVSGLEYIPPIKPGRVVVTSETYTGGRTGNASRTSRIRSEVTTVRGVNGIWLYTVKTDPSWTTLNYVTSDGLAQISQESDRLVSDHPSPALRFPFPPRPGLEFSTTLVLKDKQTRRLSTQTTERSLVPAVDDTVTVGGESHTGVVRLDRSREVKRVDVSGETSTTTFAVREWCAPRQHGLVPSITQNQTTGETWTTDLVSVGP